MPELDGVTVFAVDVAVKPVEEGRGVQIGLAFVTAQAVLVHHAGLGYNLFYLKDLGMASRTTLGGGFVIHRKWSCVAIFVFTTRSKSSQIADATINL